MDEVHTPPGNLPAILARIEERLAALNMSADKASSLAKRPDAIRNMRRAVKTGLNAGVSMKNLSALAPVLQTSIAWLAAGYIEDEDEARADDVINVRSFDLQKIVSLVLRSEGADEDHANDLADTVVKCLSAPPLASLGGDVVRSFEVRFELQAQQSVRSGPQ